MFTQIPERHDKVLAGLVLLDILQQTVTAETIALAQQIQGPTLMAVEAVAGGNPERPESVGDESLRILRAEIDEILEETQEGRFS